MKHLEPTIAGNLLHRAKPRLQRRFIRQMPVRNKPELPCRGEHPCRRLDERHPKRGFGAAACVKWRVHHHCVHPRPRLPSRRIRPMEFGTWIGHILAGTLKSHMIRLNEIESLDRFPRQNFARQIAPPGPKIRNIAPKLGRKRICQKPGSRINTIGGEHTRLGHKTLNLHRRRTPIGKIATAKPEQLAMRLGHHALNLGSLLAVFQNAVRAIGFLSIDDHKIGHGHGPRNQVARQLLGPRKEHDRHRVTPVLRDITRITCPRECLILNTVWLNDTDALALERPKIAIKVGRKHRDPPAFRQFEAMPFKGEGQTRYRHGPLMIRARIIPFPWCIAAGADGGGQDPSPASPWFPRFRD